MPDVSTKIQRKLDRGLDPYVDKGSFRHFRGYQERWGGEAKNRYEKIRSSVATSKVATKLKSFFSMFGVPISKEEFNGYCQMAFKEYESVPVSCVVEKLKPEIKAYVKDLREIPYSEPLFTRVLPAEERRKALAVLNCINNNDKPEAVLLLDSICQEGGSVEDFMRKENLNNTVVEAVNQLIFP